MPQFGGKAESERLTRLRSNPQIPRRSHRQSGAQAERMAVAAALKPVPCAKHRSLVSGDTGFAGHVGRIGERFGPFDLRSTKIGADGSSQSCVDIHMSAEDAVRVHQDVRGKRMFPVHWDTFNLAFHDWDEPVKRAQVAARVAQMDLLTPRPGEAVGADPTFASGAWWEAVRQVQSVRVRDLSPVHKTAEHHAPFSTCCCNAAMADSASDFVMTRPTRQPGISLRAPNLRPVLSSVIVVPVLDLQFRHRSA